MYNFIVHAAHGHPAQCFRVFFRQMYELPDILRETLRRYWHNVNDLYHRGIQVLHRMDIVEDCSEVIATHDC